jgi:hypothetical protein
MAAATHRPWPPACLSGKASGGMTALIARAALEASQGGEVVRLALWHVGPELVLYPAR